VPPCTYTPYRTSTRFGSQRPPAKIDPQVPLAARRPLACNGVRQDPLRCLSPCAVGSAHSNVTRPRLPSGRSPTALDSLFEIHLAELPGWDCEPEAHFKTRRTTLIG
jgi:hypothetical protein